MRSKSDDEDHDRGGGDRHTGSTGGRCTYAGSWRERLRRRIAAAVALAVTEVGNSGLGGEGYGIFYNTQTAQTSALCFTSEPGSRVYAEQLTGKDLTRGVLAPLVPGASPAGVR